MAKRRRTPQGNKKRKRAFRLLMVALLFFVFILASVPYIKHISTYRNAISHYDFQIASQELTWIEEKASWLKKIPLIQEGEVWLKLNQGSYEDLEQVLAKYDDNSHRLWLFQLYLLKDQSDKAKSIIPNFDSPAYTKLSEGLLWADQEDYEKAVNALLTINDGDLALGEQVMKNIALARSYMAQGKFEQARRFWQVAAGLSSNHPLVVETEYDLALSSGQWGRAKELSNQLSTDFDNPYKEQLLVKKALLALVVGDRTSYQESLKELETKENGEAYTRYFKGLEMYERGEFASAMEDIQGALELGLPSFLEVDASQALAQVKERVEAERALKAITGKSTPGF